MELAVGRMGNILDRAISAVSPVSGARRMAARAAMEGFGRVSRGEFRTEARSRKELAEYRGAGVDRLIGRWNPGGGSADADLTGGLSTLRARSRDLVQNNGYASGMALSKTNNVIGTGIRPQSRVDGAVLGLSEEESAAVSRRAEEAWARWVPTADAAGRLDFYELQWLAYHQRFVNGESLALARWLDDGASLGRLRGRFVLQLLESDRLESPWVSRGATGSPDIRMGVETGKLGEALAYWILKKHPGDTYTFQFLGAGEFTRIPARDDDGRPNVIHLFRPTRAGQSRGAPELSSVLHLFRHLDQYLEAEVIAARIASCFALFIQQGDAFALQSGNVSETTSSGVRLEDLDPGIIAYGGPGDQMTQIQPVRPGSTFDPFVRRVLRQVGASCSFPYSVLSWDFSDASWSSLRQEILEAQRQWRSEQAWFSRTFCQPVWELALENAYLRGEFEAPEFYRYRAAYCRCRWIPPGWQWVDPAKEVLAIQKALALNLTTLADEAANRGKDWEEVIEQRGREIRRENEAGVAPVAPVAKP